MKSTIFILLAPVLAAALPTTTADASIILGKFIPAPAESKAFWAAWPSQSDPCTSNDVHTIAGADLAGMCGVAFSVGSNSNFTDVEAKGCQDGFANTTVAPVKGGASPIQLCIAVGPHNETCHFNYVFESHGLCGGPMTWATSPDKGR